VGHLRPNVEERDVEDVFRRFGRIRHIWIARR
jgi:hypothetical protein